MIHLIDKDALVAEIERRMDSLWELLPDASDVLQKGMTTAEEACNTGSYMALEKLLSFINTLDVKEVDLEKEVELWYNEYAGNLRFDWNGFAKHFFELGLKAKQG